MIKYSDKEDKQAYIIITIVHNLVNKNYIITPERFVLGQKKH